MTGFGDAEFEVEGVVLSIDLRSVNHRHFDVRLRVPSGMNALEAKLRTQIASRIARGKVDATLRFSSGAPPVERVDLNFDAADQYVEAARTLGARHELGTALDARTLLTLPGVARPVERAFPEEALETAASAALDVALEGLLAMRAAEGAALERDLTDRLARCGGYLEQVEERAHKVQEAVRTRLRRRAERLAEEIEVVDEGRIHQEIVHAADRLDVAEEIVRLHSHIDQFKLMIDGAQPGTAVGRRLDFLLQEMAREANTIGSKISDASAAHLVVELKNEFERIREQVQNVE